MPALYAGELEAAAFHEAGHAIADLHAGRPLVGVSLDPAECVLEEDEWTDGPDPAVFGVGLGYGVPDRRRRVWEVLYTTLAGAVAEKLFTRAEGFAPGFSSTDLGIAWRLSGYLAPGDEATRYEWLERARDHAEGVVLDSWGVVEAVAARLLEEGSLTGDEVAAEVQRIAGLEERSRS